MQFITSAAAIRSLGEQSSPMDAKTALVSDNQAKPSFHSITKVNRAAPLKVKKKKNHLLLTLVLLGGLISGTEVYLLISKLSVDQDTQVAEISTGQITQTAALAE